MTYCSMSLFISQNRNQNVEAHCDKLNTPFSVACRTTTSWLTWCHSQLLPLTVDCGLFSGTSALVAWVPSYHVSHWSSLSSWDQPLCMARRSFYTPGPLEVTGTPDLNVLYGSFNTSDNIVYVSAYCKPADSCAALHCTCSVGKSVLMYSTALKSALSSGSWLGKTLHTEGKQWLVKASRQTPSSHGLTDRQGMISRMIS